MIVCPSCGANLKFDAKSQRMKCDFCGSVFDPKEFDVQNDAEEHEVPAEQVEQVEQAEQATGDDTYDVTIYTCPQCGGELLSVDQNTAAAFCSFCGASTILSSRIAKGKRPEFIIPFSKTKEDCKEAYLKLTKKAWFLPKEYKSKESIDGFRGIYMPYWSYDVKQDGPVRLSGETEHRSGDYIITKHYSLTGEIDASYEGLSYDASSSFADNISEALAPFDIKERVPFEPAYMSGYYADIADVEEKVYSDEASEFAYDRSVERIKNETPEFRKYTIKGDKREGAKGPGTAFRSRAMKGHSSMFPVWFMSYRNGDRVTYATVNGQTGKVAADLPIDVKKYLIFSGILAVIIFVILNFFLVLTPKAVLITASILTICVFFINGIQRDTIKKAVTGENDKGVQNLNNRLRNKNGKDAGKKKEPKVSQEVPEAQMSGFEKITMILGIASIVIAILMLFVVKVVSDMPYYVICVFDAVVFILCFRYTLHNYNLMATRRLPQFDRKGGDDRA